MKASRQAKPYKSASARQPYFKKADKGLSISKSEGPAGYMHPRSTTAFRYFNIQGKRQAGPHTMSHVFTKVGMGRISQSKNVTDFRTLLRTRLIPSPPQANAILKEGLGRESRLAMTNPERESHLKQYTSLYNRLVRTEDRDEQLRLAGKLIELGPQQTYAWDRGSYTPDEIKGKGETEAKAQRDYFTLADLKSAPGYSQMTGEESRALLQEWVERGFSSIDPSGMSDEDLRRVMRRAVQFSKLEDDETLSQVSHQSDMDFSTKNERGEYFVSKRTTTPASRRSAASQARVSRWLKS